MRLIDAEDFKQEIIKSLGIPCEGYLLESEKKIYYMIDKQPTIEAEPVRHGRWLRGSAYPHHIFCSVCYATYIPNDEIPLWKSESYFNVPRNYCPNCGAKMDGERRTDETD